MRAVAVFRRVPSPKELTNLLATRENSLMASRLPDSSTHKEPRVSSVADGSLGASGTHEECCVASVGDELSIFLKQLVEIQLLMTAGGVGFLCCCCKRDLTTIPPLEDLLNAREG